MDIVLTIFLILLIILLGLGAWRFFFVRSSGTPIIVRRLPQNGLHGWRHGVLRYSVSEATYYKVRSLTPGADIIFNRNQIEILGHREATNLEAPVLLGNRRILQFNFAGDKYEATFPAGAEMAFISWIESAPDARLERIDVQTLRRKFTA